jgi:hypothetical protein
MSAKTSAKNVERPILVAKIFSHRVRSIASIQSTKGTGLIPEILKRGHETGAGIQNYPDAIAPNLSPERKTDYAPVGIYSTLTFPRQPQGEKKWSVSGWFVFRPNEAVANGPANGQLSGSQYGARFQHGLIRVSNSANLNFNLRASAPIDNANDREVSIGLALKIRSKLPIELILERRVPIDAGTPAFAAILATGVNDVRISKAISLNGYLQTGFVTATRIEPFIDGSATIERDIGLGSRSSVRVGAGIWGAAQSSTMRLDIGPLIAAQVPIGNRSLRFAAEWRQRVLGNALPASGPAISISADF